MKTKNYIIVSIGICALFVTVQSSFSQGTLTPPSAPAPTMKSLDQIEPRTPITYDGYNINSPGSYYVTTNLFGAAFGIPGSPYGIFIASDNVTVDLNGFTLQGVSGSYTGIYIYGSHTNIIVRNGIITGWAQNGIGYNYPYSSPQNVVLQHLTVAANSGNGIVAANGFTISDCTIQNNQGTGILLDGNGSQVIGNILIGNNAANNISAGAITIEGSNNRIEGNHITGSGSSGYGIALNYGGTTGNIVIKNSVSGNGANNYSIAAGNDLGPVGTAASSTSPWANISH